MALVVMLLPISNYQRYANDRLGFVLELLLCAAVALVGRWPIPASLAACLILAALLVLPLEAKRPSLVVVLIAIASLGAHGYRWIRAGVVAWYLIVTLLIENNPPQTWNLAVAGAVSYLVLVTAAWAIGDAVSRIAAERAQSRIDRTSAVQAQRRTIARDLHDTIAYSTTSIILRAEQAKLRGVSDPRMAEDLDYIINAGRSSMRDLRGMMETLRRNEPDALGAAHSPWQISSLDDVLEARTAELREHGFRVSSHVEADGITLPESVRETLGKVVVEATSNMVKHGDPSAPASIMVEADRDAVEAIFINKPLPSRAGRRDTAQLGLLGARERVEALGGEVHVTSESPNWVVRVVIPMGG